MDEAQLIDRCLETVRAALPPHAEAVLRAGPPVTGHPAGPHPAEGRLQIAGPGGTFDVVVEAKARVNEAAVAMLAWRMAAPAGGHVQERADRPDWLLFTEYVPLRRAQELRDRGIAFADTCGNVHLWGPGVYVWVAGHRPTKRKTRTPRLMQPAAARVLFVLLQQPQRAREPYRELARLAGVAPDTVNRVFADLEARNQLKLWGTRERALVDLPRLLEVWTQAYVDVLRPKLRPKRCRWLRRGGVEELGHLIEERRIEVDDDREIPRILLGGELGATAFTETLRPATAALHVMPGAQKDVMQLLDLVPHDAGEVTLLETFGETNAWVPPDGAVTELVDPLLIQAELLVTDDDRIRLVAEELYEQVIVKRFTHDR